MLRRENHAPPALFSGRLRPNRAGHVYAEWFEWLADGAIIHAWQLIRKAQADGKVPDCIQLVRQRLLDASDRGPPLYTEGVRLLIEGLRWLMAATEGKDVAANKALQQATAYVMALDPSSPVTTFTGIGVDRPSPAPRYGSPLVWGDMALLWGVTFPDLMVHGLLEPGQQLALRFGGRDLKAQIDVNGVPILADGTRMERLDVRDLNLDASRVLETGMSLAAAVGAAYAPPAMPPLSQELRARVAELDAAAAYSPDGPSTSAPVATIAGYLAERLEPKKALRMLRATLRNRREANDVAGELQVRLKLLSKLVDGSQLDEVRQQVESVWEEKQAFPSSALSDFFRGAAELYATKLGAPDEALPLLNRALDIEPEEFQSLTLLVRVASSLDDMPLLAHTALRLAALALGHEGRAHWLEVGAAAFERAGQEVDAIALYEQLVNETASQNAAGRLIELYQQVGQPERAGRLLLQLANGTDDQAEARHFALQASRELASVGDLEGAVEAWQVFLRHASAEDVRPLVGDADSYLHGERAKLAALLRDHVPTLDDAPASLAFVTFVAQQTWMLLVAGKVDEARRVWSMAASWPRRTFDAFQRTLFAHAMPARGADVDIDALLKTLAERARDSDEEES